jgi:hypothetical protein
VQRTRREVPARSEQTEETEEEEEEEDLEEGPKWALELTQLVQ